MKKLLNLLKISTLITFTTFLTGCFGVIETGQVGIRTMWNGNVEKEEVEQGIYQHFISSVKKFSVKQIPIQLDDLKPKAADNLRLQEMDVTIYYTVHPSAVSDLYIKYNSSIEKDAESGIYYPAYVLVKNLAKSATNDAVSKIQSMDINIKRVELENQIKNMLQTELNGSDNGKFTIDRVNITNIITDKTVEDSIREIATSENRKKIALNNLEIAKTQAQEYEVKSKAITGAVLAEKQLSILEKLAISPNKVFIVPQDFKNIGLINLDGNQQK